MATTYPLPTLGPTIDATGISIPSYNDIYQSLVAHFQSIYGSSIYISADSQDGQWLAILASAINDSNQAAVDVFQAFSPTYSQGAALSSLVKINGLIRNVPTYSTAVGDIVGVAGSEIINGVVKDANNNLWNLPALVIIPTGGSISVTVTAQTVGAIIAPTGTINSIYNPQRGWQSFTNTSDAVSGVAVESDALLRQRQTVSTAIPATTVLEAIYSAIGNVTGVQRWFVYENDTGVTNSNGIPAHSVCVVVLGGNVADIAAAIDSKKPPGIQTYGSTSQIVYSSFGLATTINFFILTLIPIYFGITIKALSGYVSTTATAIQTALSNFVNALDIGVDVYMTQAQAIASLMNSGLGQTFTITNFTLGTTAAPTGTVDLPIAFNEAATCSPSNIAITVV